MDTRREFLKKMAFLAGASTLPSSLANSLTRAMSIDPELGSSFYDAEHIVLLMQENRSFDHAFGTLQGVRGFNDPRAIRQPNRNKVWLQTNEKGQTYAPFRLDIKDTKVTWMGCLPHNWTDQTDAYNQGKMDRWLDVKRSGFKEFSEMPLTMGYYNREDIPFYYALADAFTVCDQYFCSSLTGTNPNRLYFWTGNIREQKANGKALVWNGDSEFSGKANWRTFPERLSEHGVSWKVYQNEISSSSAGYSGEENSWLGNFGCNVLEYFPQYEVKYSQRYKEVLALRKVKLSEQLATMDAEGKKGEAYDRLQQALQTLETEITQYAKVRIEDLPDAVQELHRRAFVNNSADAQYMELETMRYQDGDTERELRIPKGDILYQFRKDVEEGQLPTVSWLVPPQLFSDHPDSPWFGSWYVSEVMDILTKNPEVWKKTIFILTYDENDGYFDHVVPFAPPNPYQEHTGKVSEGIDAKLEYVKKEQQYHAESGRESHIGLGYRVPMIVASPWSRGGWVNSQVFDHTSPLQFLEKFISHKVGKEVKEDNITSWRRTVCGDLTSVFRPYRGEKMNPIESLEKESFMQAIHRAKFKKLPFGYKSLTKEEIALINENPMQSPLFPKQESGTRPSNALPYELYVDGEYDFEGSYHITFKSGNQLFGAKTAGAAFKVYALNRYQSDEGKNWDYALAANSTLKDTWQLKSFDNERYDFAVHGPNGFYRQFKGGKHNPKVQIKCSYDLGHAHQSNKSEAQLLFVCRNAANEDYNLIFKDNSYGQEPKVLTLKKREEAIVKIDTSHSGQWYDISVTCLGYSEFEEQFAGRIETGLDGITDPLMGR